MCNHRVRAISGEYLAERRTSIVQPDQDKWTSIVQMDQDKRTSMVQMDQDKGLSPNKIVKGYQLLLRLYWGGFFVICQPSASLPSPVALMAQAAAS
jgi:hypothetical protein